MNQQPTTLVTGNDLIDKLYEGTLTYLEKAEQGIIENNETEKDANIHKALAVINEMNTALDHQSGGYLATKLALLYQYSIHNLHTVRQNNDVNELRHVKKIIIKIKSAFQLTDETDEPSEPVRLAM